MAKWTSAPLCPLDLTKRLIRVGRHKGHMKLFGKISASKNGKDWRIRGQMMYSRARKQVRDAFRRVRLEPDKYGLHSLRSGGVSDAAAAGIPDRLIWRHGGWRSKTAVLAYFKETMANLMSVLKALQPK